MRGWQWLVAVRCCKTYLAKVHCNRGIHIVRRYCVVGSGWWQSDAVRLISQRFTVIEVSILYVDSAWLAVVGGSQML